MQSAHLLAGVEPDKNADPHKLPPDIDLWYWEVKNAVTLGRIPAKGGRLPGPANDLLEPARVVAWARTKETKDRKIPKQFRDIKPTEPNRSARPLGKRERDTLLTIIEALAKAANIDTSKSSKAAGEIEKLTVGIGTRVPARTIENHLKRIPEAVEDRTNKS